MGQLSLLIRARFLVDAIPMNKVQGKPFFRTEIHAKVRELLGAEDVH